MSSLRYLILLITILCLLDATNAYIIPKSEIDGKCGPNNGNFACPGNLCCSQFGFCGSTSDYCEKGCQSQFGKCNSPTTTTTTLPREKPTAPATLPVSTDGTCGSQKGNTVCPNSDCCSPNGFCGSTKDYCGTGCQEGFGFCGIIEDGLEIITTCSDKNKIAITFDDGPAELTSKLLDELASRNVQATFFMNGHARQSSCIYDYAELVQRIHKEGHLIGSHTWSHPHLAQVSDEEIAYQFEQLEVAFTKILGTTPKYFRPPFGEGLNDPRIRKELLNRGYKVILWDTDTRDFIETLETAKGLFLQQLENSNGEPRIVLNHDAVNSTCEKLAPFEIDYAISKAYNVQTVGHCIGDTNPENWYNDPVVYGKKDDTWKCTLEDMHLNV